MALQPASIQNCNPPPVCPSCTNGYSFFLIQYLWLHNLSRTNGCSTLQGCTIIPVPVRVPVTVPMDVQFLQCTITWKFLLAPMVVPFDLYQQFLYLSWPNGCSFCFFRSVPIAHLYFLYQWLFHSFCTNGYSILPVPMFVQFILYHRFLYQCLFHSFYITGSSTSACFINSVSLVPVPVLV